MPARRPAPSAAARQGVEEVHRPIPGRFVGDGPAVQDLAREANGTLVSHRVRDRRSRCDDPYRHRKTPAAMELLTFLPLIIIMVAFMFFASRRQRKAMQATIDLHE